VPILVGFGISGADQVKAVCEVADGAIVGSALVRLVAEQAGRPQSDLTAAVEHFAGNLVAAARR
jgi:tryptophan synthase alpha chain